MILELENFNEDQNIMTKKLMATQLQVPEELWSLSSSEFGKIKSATSVRIITDGASLAVQWLGRLTFTSGGTSLMPGGGTRVSHAAQQSQK